jgi:hypothetical protein
MDYLLRQRIAVCSNLVAQLGELEQLRDRVRRAQLEARKSKKLAGSCSASGARFGAGPTQHQMVKISAAGHRK